MKRQKSWHSCIYILHASTWHLFQLLCFALYRQKKSAACVWKCITNIKTRLFAQTSGNHGKKECGCTCGHTNHISQAGWDDVARHIYLAAQYCAVRNTLATCHHLYAWTPRLTVRNTNYFLCHDHAIGDNSTQLLHLYTGVNAFLHVDYLVSIAVIKSVYIVTFICRYHWHCAICLFWDEKNQPY